MLASVSEKVSGTEGSVELRKRAGSWLRARRSELGLSQRELAVRVNMEYYTFISQIEAGRGRIPRKGCVIGRWLWKWIRESLQLN